MNLRGFRQFCTNFSAWKMEVNVTFTHAVYLRLEPFTTPFTRPFIGCPFKRLTRGLIFRI